MALAVYHAAKSAAVIAGVRQRWRSGGYRLWSGLRLRTRNRGRIREINNTDFHNVRFSGGED